MKNFPKRSFTSVFRRKKPWMPVKLHLEGSSWLKGVLNLQRKFPQYFWNSENLGKCAKIWLKLAIFTSYDLHHVSWGIKNPMMHITPQISWTLWCFAFFAFEADLKPPQPFSFIADIWPYIAIYGGYGHARYGRDPKKSFSRRTPSYPSINHPNCFF